MKITTKGQVTIPQAIREQLGIGPGSQVEFVAVRGQVILRARGRRSSPVDEWLRVATGVARGRTTTAKVMRLTRGEG